MTIRPMPRRVGGVPARLPGHDAGVLETVRQLTADVQALRARVETLERRFEADDRDYLRAIAEAFGTAAFTAPLLHRHRGRDPQLRRFLHEPTVRAMGTRLRRLRDRPLGGLVLRLVKRSHGVRVWVVSVADDRHADPCVVPAPRAE